MPETQWSQADAISLRNFIAQNPNFLATLNRRRPKVEGSTMESRAVTGSDLKGFLAALDEIEALQQDEMPDTENAGFLPSNE